MFWTWNDTSLATKKLQRTRTSIEMVKVVKHTSYFLHCFQYDLFSSSDPHIFWQTYFFIFWHSFWHLIDMSLRFFLAYLLPFFLIFCLIFFLTDFLHSVWHSFWQNFWESFWHSSFCRQTILNSQGRGTGPARRPGLTESRLGSGTPHWSHRIAVEARRATLVSQNCSEVRRATLASQNRRWGPVRHTDHTLSREETKEETKEAEEEEEKEEEKADKANIKFNNPYLTSRE